MRRLLVILFALWAVAATAQHTLRDVVVTAKRPLKEIGVQKSVIDSAALKENIAQSMADVLTYNTSIFVKSHGRATLSTVAFRGTSASHTQVTWNGLRINSPMLGMTDFSTIPSYFVDQASLLHGTSSVNETGGGLGGVVRLATAPDAAPGLHAQYIQGVGSYATFDEFLRLTYASDHWTSSTRLVCSSSPNDYSYVNHDKKLNIYDDDHNIIGQYHPRERNRSGAYRDIHAMQEVYYDNWKGDRLGLAVWYANSNRELPLLTTDYGEASMFENRQREQTPRAVTSWKHSAEPWSLDLRAGYVHTWMAYDYRRDVGGGGGMATMTRSRSRVNTFYGQGEATWMSPSRRWLLTANITAHQHLVRSADRSVIIQDGSGAIVGYDKGRIELSGALTARWQPIDRLGLSAVVRQDMFGTQWAPVIPAFFADAILWPKINLTARASVSRNYRFPTLNDLYFQPGGNPALRSEQGVSYDCGIDFLTGKAQCYSLSGGISWFDSRIDDWIIWLPTTKGFFSPRNIGRVHAYGIEGKAALTLQLPRHWLLDLQGQLSWTPSINDGEPYSEGDLSVGKQLPYVPRCSASVTGTLSWSRWSLLYKWAYYSQRFTQTSNQATITGTLPRYYMSNVTLSYGHALRWADLDYKLAINNLFDEEYLSVLARPMPGINFEVFVSITPRW